MKARILVVDDNELVLKLIQKSLEHFDIDLRCLTSGLEVLSLLDTWKPDLAILDIMLPVIDGKDLCKKIHKINGLEGLPIIFLSAKVGVENRIQGYKAGAVHYLEKPFEISEFRAMCNSFIKLVNDGGDQIEIKTNGIEVDDQFIKLTPSELRIFSILNGSKDCLVSKEKLGSNKSLDVHIKNLRDKLASTHLEITSVYGEGLMLTKKAS